MFKKERISFSKTGVLNSLVSDYLNKSEKTKEFYEHFPDLTGFKNLLSLTPYQNFDRETLVKALTDQAHLVENTSEKGFEVILKLKKKNCYTVTTGHQLCLFTGPLYFIYKIISTINLAERLSNEFPEYDFVPVYWMASEDHDFEEVNHFFLEEKKIQWKSVQQGAVGEFNTKELKSLQDEIKASLGISSHSNYLNSLFEKAYLKHNTLAEATRYFVNELFGEKGLIIIDGNDACFKQQFKSYMQADIFENTGFAKVSESIKSLTDKDYHAQVNPRKINCFYLDKNLRSRIEQEGDHYKVIGTDISFTKKELNEVLEKSPEKISPNVVLRPLYQQVILPNIAYTGGPGELAYWLEFQEFFKASGVLFPILMPRNFVLFIDKLSAKKIGKLDFKSVDIFQKEPELIQQLQKNKNAIFQIEQEAEAARKIYLTLKEKLEAIDPTLSGSAAAEEKRMANGLARLSAKANRALRRGSETEIRQIREIKTKLFPGNVPQERHKNFAEFYLQYGPAFFEFLFKELDPFAAEQYVFTES